MKKRLLSLMLCLGMSILLTTAITAQTQFKLIATKKTSTAEKEMNEAAETGFHFEAVSGGETAFGGSEVVLIMSKESNSETNGNYQYKLLATKKTSTMQKELQEAGDNGFDYCGQTVFETTFGGKEVVVILERNTKIELIKKYEYKLLATSKTSTMQKEISQAGEAGYKFVGLTTGETAIGGKEVVVIMRRDVQLKL